MRLYLAVAVLMLAFVAYTEAQEDTVEQRFSKFGEQMSELGRNLAESAKNTLEQIQRSEIATNTGRWFQDHWDKLKEKFNR